MRFISTYIIFLVATAFITSSPSFAQQPLDHAVRLIEAGKQEQAARILQPLANAGDAKAQYHLGMLLYAGHGVPENEKLAVDLLTKSAKQGNVDAMYQLGNAYTFGNDTPRLVVDADVEAAQWYFKAAKAGNAEAQYSLGLLFMAGKGVERNNQEANYWMQLAAKNGHKDASNYVNTGK